MIGSKLIPKIDMGEKFYKPSRVSPEAMICMSCSPDAKCKDRCERYNRLKAQLKNQQKGNK